MCRWTCTQNKEEKKKDKVSLSPLQLVYHDLIIQSTLFANYCFMLWCLWVWRYFTCQNEWEQLFHVADTRQPWNLLKAREQRHVHMGQTPSLTLPHIRSIHTQTVRLTNNQETKLLIWWEIFWRSSKCLLHTSKFVTLFHSRGRATGRQAVPQQKAPWFLSQY